MEDVYLNHIEVRVSNISGRGTFARKKISKGEYITTLCGDPLVTNDINSTCTARGMPIDDPLQIGDNLFLILDYASKTINHSCEPNAAIKNISDLYAIKDIYPNDEITYDYSTTSGINDIWAMKCDCRSPLCRIEIGNILSIPPHILQQYIHREMLPIYIKKQLIQQGTIPAKAYSPLESS